MAVQWRFFDAVCQEAANDFDLIILELGSCSGVIRCASLPLARTIDVFLASQQSSRLHWDSRASQSQNHQQPINFSQLHDFSPHQHFELRRSQRNDGQSPLPYDRRICKRLATLHLPCESVTGFFTDFPALIFTTGVFAFGLSIDTTVAVPTALFSSPV